MDTCKSARRLFYFLVAPGDPDLTHHMTSLACDRLHSGTPERGGRGEQAPLLPIELQWIFRAIVGLGICSGKGIEDNETRTIIFGASYSEAIVRFENGLLTNRI